MVLDEHFSFLATPVWVWEDILTKGWFTELMNELINDKRYTGSVKKIYWEITSNMLLNLFKASISEYTYPHFEDDFFLFRSQ